jgi:hypothetical protein
MVFTTLDLSKQSGVVETDNLGSGTASSSTVLFGDQTFKTAPSGELVRITSQAFPNANNFTIDNIFSSSYVNYIMMINMLNTDADDSLDFVFVKSGTPDTSSRYRYTVKGYSNSGSN